MDIKDLRKKKTEDLMKMIEQLNQEIPNTYLNMRMGKVKNVREPRRLRKDLAVLNTVIREKQQHNLKHKKDNE